MRMAWKYRYALSVGQYMTERARDDQVRSTTGNEQSFKNKKIAACFYFVEAHFTPLNMPRNQRRIYSGAMPKMFPIRLRLRD